MVHDLAHLARYFLYLCRVQFPDDSTELALLVGARIAAELRVKVESETGYTCSAGVATNKLFAKIGSGKNKPTAQTVRWPGLGWVMKHLEHHPPRDQCHVNGVVRCWSQLALFWTAWGWRTACYMMDLFRFGLAQKGLLVHR